MIYQTQVDRRGLAFFLSGFAVAALFLFAGHAARAQNPACGVGTRVVFDDGQRGVGTILQIGTESPHVGWYRIGFSWQPKGEWFSPKSWGILIEGTKTKCGQENAAKPANAGRTTAPAAGAQNAETGASPGAGACSFDAPPGKVTKTSPASAALFKRVIYEREAAKVNPESISAPKRVGLTFLKFEMGAAYKNTLTGTKFGDKRRYDGAPVGAMIYPVKTTELQCDLHGEQVRRSVQEVERNCFKNRDGEWTCPGRTTKFVENKLLPVE